MPIPTDHFKPGFFDHKGRTMSGEGTTGEYTERPHMGGKESADYLALTQKPEGPHSHQLEVMSRYIRDLIARLNTLDEEMLFIRENTKVAFLSHVKRIESLQADSQNHLMRTAKLEKTMGPRQYRSHKLVQAFKIVKIEAFPTSAAMGMRLIFENGSHLKVGYGYMARCEPVVDGYYIYYEYGDGYIDERGDKGYESYLPAKVFENSHSLLIEKGEM